MSWLSKLVNDTGNEINRTGDNLQEYGQDIVDASVETYKILTGEYASDNEDVDNKIRSYEAAVEAYEKYVESQSNKTIFNDEIINISVSNKITKAYEALMVLEAQVMAAIEDFKEEYSYTLELTRSDLGGVILFLPMVIGGMLNDLNDFLTAGDWEAGRALMSTVLSLIGILLTFITVVITSILSVVFPVLIPVAIALAVSLVAQLASLVISLDSRYNQGMLMGNIFMSLDFVFNQMLGFEDWLSKDFSKLGDAEYYAELTGYVQTGLAITIAISAVVSMMAAPAAGTQAANAMNSAMAGTGTLSKIMGLLNTAMTVGDIAGAYEHSEKLKKELEKKKVELDERIRIMSNNKMVKSYKQVEDMLNDTYDISSNYVMSGFAEPGATFDPEMTILANFGYRRTDENIMSFGFEDVFSESVQAGDPNYVRNILYRI